MLNWLVGLEIDNNNYMTLHAHIWNEKKVHKKEGCGTYCENKSGKGNVDPIHFWNLCNMVPFFEIDGLWIISVHL